MQEYPGVHGRFRVELWLGTQPFVVGAQRRSDVVQVVHMQLQDKPTTK